MTTLCKRCLPNDGAVELEALSMPPLGPCEACGALDSAENRVYVYRPLTTSAAPRSTR